MAINYGNQETKIGHKRHRTKTNKRKYTTQKKMNNTDSFKKRRRVNLGARKQVAAPYKTFLGVLIVKSDTSLVGDKIKIIFGKGKRLITT